MTQNFKKKIERLKSKFYFNYDTSKNVWFRAGGKVDIFCIVYDEYELKIILNEIDDMPYEIIGAGSNFLIRDNGFKGILFKLGKNFNKIEKEEKILKIGASILDVNLARYAKKNHIKNFEFYSGIPGSIGGAVKMNAGCYGSETKNILKGIKTIDANGNFNYFTKDNLNLGYRKSNIPKGNIVLAADYFYEYGEIDDINEKINNIKVMRENSQPIKSKTSGSSFKNPPNNYAAKLIEESECKGLNVGDVYVSQKHANFLINSDKATATQIEDLGKLIIEKVYKKFNIKLEWEIKIIGI